MYQRKIYRDPSLTIDRESGFSFLVQWRWKAVFRTDSYRKLQLKLEIPPLAKMHCWALLYTSAQSSENHAIVSAGSSLLPAAPLLYVAFTPARPAKCIARSPEPPMENSTWQFALSLSRDCYTMLWARKLKTSVRERERERGRRGRGARESPTFRASRFYRWRLTNPRSVN